MKKKGFTLVELLVVISVIALLMAILMPALSKVKSLANQVVCGTNLSGIGKAMLLYDADNDGQLPLAGVEGGPSGPNAGFIEWAGGSAPTQNGSWDNKSKSSAFSQGFSTISSCLYLLVKYADVQTKQFVCRADVAEPLDFYSQVRTGPNKATEPYEAWDFGRQPGRYCSYSYHNPFGSMALNGYGYPVNLERTPDAPLCADRNPWLDNDAAIYINQVGSLAPTGYFDGWWNTTDRQFEDPGPSAPAAID